jgi:hypothetical protein
MMMVKTIVTMLLFSTFFLITACASTTNLEGEDFAGIIVAKDNEYILVVEFPYYNQPNAYKIEYNNIHMADEQQNPLGIEELQIGSEIKTKVTDVRKENPGHAKVTKIVIKKEQNSFGKISKQEAIAKSIQKLDANRIFYIQDIVIQDEYYLIKFNDLFERNKAVKSEVNNSTGEVKLVK